MASIVPGKIANDFRVAGGPDHDRSEISPPGNGFFAVHSASSGLQNLNFRFSIATAHRAALVDLPDKETAQHSGTTPKFRHGSNPGGEDHGPFGGPAPAGPPDHAKQ